MVEPGDKLGGRFLIDRELNRGCYGFVVLAVDEERGQTRAVKLVPKTDRQGFPDATFNAEVSALRALENQEGVPELFSTGEVGQFRYLVIDVLDGDLQEIRDRNPGKVFKLTTVFQLMWHIMKGLEGIHSRGILHRDIKLANIMIRRRYGTSRVIFVDFGLSKRFLSETDGSRLPRIASDLNFLTCAHAAPKASAGLACQETEDLISAGYSAVFMRNYIPWLRADNHEMCLEKIKFGRNPELYLHREDMVMVPLLKQINSQVYGQVPNYRVINNLIQFELIVANLSVVLDVKFVHGQLRLE